MEHKNIGHDIGKAKAEKIGVVELVSSLCTRLATLLKEPNGLDYINSNKKRILDIALSAIFIPIALPIGIVSALLIKLEDGGPIFYIAHVPGKNGEEFGLIKLRTMKQEQPTQDPIFYKKKDDSRITRFGAFARRMAIDEVPQLINVLKGDMSIIGRRPMFQQKVEELAKIDQLSDVYVPWLQATTSAKPGLFDLATGRGRALLDQDMPGLRRRLRYETFAVTHASLGFDLRIAREAIAAGIKGKGAF